MPLNAGTCFIWHLILFRQQQLSNSNTCNCKYLRRGIYLKSSLLASKKFRKVTKKGDGGRGEVHSNSVCLMPCIGGKSGFTSAKQLSEYIQHYPILSTLQDYLGHQADTTRREHHTDKTEHVLFAVGCKKVSNGI